MKIAIDLEGTLICECAEFTCEYASSLALRLVPNRPRRGARALFQDLVRAGHRVTIYTSKSHAPWRLRLWCHLVGLPVCGVLTAKTAEVWPPCEGFDLLIDDDIWNLEVARRAKVKFLRITNHSADWTQAIREATLLGEGIDLRNGTQPA